MPPTTRAGTTSSIPGPSCSPRPSTGCPSSTATRWRPRDGCPGAIVGAPGCYPTTTILALAPLARAGLIGDLVVDAKSGVSGAGRDPKADLHFGEVNESVKAYGAFTHRHTAEIEQELGALGPAGDNPGVVGGRLPASPRADDARHPVCLPRPADAPGEPGRDRRAVRRGIRERAVRDGHRHPPATKHVLGSNEFRVWCGLDPRNGRILAIGVLDNLVKGAAGQAVQAFNVVHALPEPAGLLQLPLAP